MIKCIFEKKFIGAEYCAECPIVCPLYTFGIGKETCKLGDHDRRSVRHLWAFCGFL